jgi:hypothetical protein
MEQIQQNGAIIAVVALVGIPLIYTFRKYTYPAIFHTAEYSIYFAVVHLIVAGLTRAGAYFALETKFKNYNGTIKDTYVEYTTPWVQFWDKTLYAPQGLFYFECVMALILLYVVIFIRPMRIKSNNAYKKKKDKAREQAAAVRTGGATYDRANAAPRGASKSKLK